MIKVKDLMALERLLLEIDNRFKFQLRFSEVIELNEFLEEIGKITDLFFSLQDEHFRKFGDSDALTEYHEKLMEEEVKVNTHRMIGLVNDVCNRFVDDEFAEIVLKNKFWG